jgi:uncharacterized protein (TIGR03067 family)
VQCKHLWLAGGVVFFAGVFVTMARGAEPFDPKILPGTWVCESATIDGRPLDEATARQLRLTLTADRYKSERGDQVLFDSTYTVNASKSPAEIDMIGTAGELKGKAAPGIVKLEADRLSLCYVMPGRPRPTKYESQPGSGVFLVTYKRVDPK